MEVCLKSESKVESRRFDCSQGVMAVFRGVPGQFHLKKNYNTIIFNFGFGLIVIKWLQLTSLIEMIMLDTTMWGMVDEI